VLTLSSLEALVNEGPSAGITLARWGHPMTGGGQNPALCIRDYLLSTVYGWGLPAAMIDEPSFATAAAYCEALIDYPLTAGNDNTTRLMCNGVLDTGKTLQSNLEELLSSCRGAIDWSGGTAKLLIRSETGPAAVLALSPANIVGQWSFRNAGNTDRWNLVTASYVDPLNGEFKAAQTQWPPIGSNAYLTADNSFLNRLDLSLPFTNDGAMAQMIAQITLNESRNGISCSVRCTEEALQVSVGDLVTVTHDTPGWDVKPFWVQRMELLPDTNVVLTLSEYEPDAYDLATMEDRRTYAATSHVTTETGPGHPITVGFSRFTPAVATRLWTYVSSSYATATAASGLPYLGFAHLSRSELDNGVHLTNMTALFWYDTTGAAGDFRTALYEIPNDGSAASEIAFIQSDGSTPTGSWTTESVAVDYIVDWDANHYAIATRLNSGIGGSVDNARYMWTRLESDGT
jgi:hypothetical protein